MDRKSAAPRARRSSGDDRESDRRHPLAGSPAVPKESAGLHPSRSAEQRSAQVISKNLFLRLLSGIREGSLELTCENGATLRFGQRGETPSAHVSIHQPRF